ncbi:MAG: hypothetical protein FWC26_03660 [Fibromonadales bacterium]|nr:hypothetical protein [Fibromonadales bacterium]
MFSKKTIILFLFLCATAFADTTATAIIDTTAIDTTIIDTTTIDIAIIDTTVIDTTIKPGLHFFVSVGAQFINFKDRSKFKALLDTQFIKYQGDYLADTAGFLIPQRQPFQTVNLAFPIMAGIIWQFNDMHSLGLGAGFLYNNESVVLTDKKGETRNYKYALQAFPLFVEYRLLVSPNLISIKNGDYFSLFLRYYWMLPGTEIYSSWGNAKADFDPLGSGYGVFFGYRFWEWNGFSVWGELGYLSLDVKSGDKNGILDSWNLGGVSIMVRVMF